MYVACFGGIDGAQRYEYRLICSRIMVNIACRYELDDVWLQDVCFRRR